MHFSEIDDHRDPLTVRLDRFARAHGHALEVAGTPELQRAYPDRAQRLVTCATHLLFRRYVLTGDHRLHAGFFCQQPLLCQACAIRRGARLVARYMRRLERVLLEESGLNPYLVTLTVRDGPDLRERFNHLRVSLSRAFTSRRLHLSNPRRNAWTPFAVPAGGFGSIEVKRGSGSGLWHPHFHAVWLCHTPPSQVDLSDSWHATTGDSFVVDIRPIADRLSGVLEVAKYSVKVSGQAGADVVEAFRVLSRRRLFSSFGLLRGLDDEDDGEEFDPEADGPFVELVARFVDGGYTVSRRPDRGTC